MKETEGGLAHAEGPWSDLAIHTIGWKAFQDLCSQVAEEVFKRPVQIYREAQDGGQDAVFLAKKDEGDVDATIQSKYSSDPKRRLKPGDLTAELDSVKALVESGQADTYVLMTSMGVDAGIARQIREKLRKIGVRKPHVLGKEFLVRTIRGSVRLRALVPQVYGLGDLSVILDQRILQQTRALLAQWLPKLDRYVPTDAHRQAVKALSEHGIVLLLGNPSTGKSTIGAILSTIATEDEHATVMKLGSPREFEDAWNPAERKRFFWIDDAFGPNTMRDDYVQDWPSAFTKIQAAMALGNRFLLTSRRHIYAAAKSRLGQRNHPLLVNGSAIVDVGALTLEEKSQILYNHIAFGNQTQSWKRSVKDKLETVAAVDNFLPGIAERLGDPNFTRGLATSEPELIRFMKEPKEHLIDTINALETPLRAGLMLIYVHQGALASEDFSDDACVTVAEMLDIPLSRIHEGMMQLLGSFAQKYSVAGKDVWSFAHPTIADAITSILSERSHMIAALLRGARIETILSGFICEGVDLLLDAATIPSTLDDILVARLLACENALSINRSLFSFLAYRASDAVLQKLITEDPTFIERESWHSASLGTNPKLIVYARVHYLGLLTPAQRDWASNRLERLAIDDFDLAFLDDEKMLTLVYSNRLVALGMRLSADVLQRIQDDIEDIRCAADLDEDPDSQFDVFQSSLQAIENLEPFDRGTNELIEEAREAIRSAISDIKERREERDRENEDGSPDWNYMSVESKSPAEPLRVEPSNKHRSIFVDVDR